VASLDYSAAGVAVRGDLIASHRALLEHIASPGTWFSGAERVAIARESRAAPDCALCHERRAALSPFAVEGRHDAATDLPDLVVEVAHRIRTDSGRLSRKWFDGVLDSGLDDARYVEIVGVVTLMAGLDYFTRALGLAPPPLPEPRPGEPSRHRPAGARPHGSWVPTVAPEDATGPEQGLYGDTPFVPNIMRACSLVPDATRMLIVESNSHYVRVDQIADATVSRDLSRPQMELVAARVSALNECFY
jgi:alkylhydroperoxidase family enzyme